MLVNDFTTIYCYFPKEFVDHLQSLQPAKAVIIGIIHGLLPLTSPPGEDHLTNRAFHGALQCYKGFYEAERSRQTNEDLKTTVRHRKDLLKADRIIGDKYLQFIKEHVF